MGKDILRSKLLQSLDALTENEIQSLNLSLTNQIIKFMNLRPELIDKMGAGYLPLKAEIAPDYQLLLREVPLSLAYPILKDAQMGFAVPEKKAEGTLWLKAPYREVKPSWFFIPGVGFSLDGRRLGRGKGFYDRYLEASQVLKIGICWSEQLDDNIPVESHDCHMDFIITEKFCWDVHQQVKF